MTYGITFWAGYWITFVDEIQDKWLRYLDDFSVYITFRYRLSTHARITPLLNCLWVADMRIGCDACLGPKSSSSGTHACRGRLRPQCLNDQQQSQSY